MQTSNRAIKTIDKNTKVIHVCLFTELFCKEFSLLITMYCSYSHFILYASSHMVEHSTICMIFFVHLQQNTLKHESEVCES